MFFKEKGSQTHRSLFAFSVDIKHLIPFFSLRKKISFLGQCQLKQHVICLPSLCQLARSESQWGNRVAVC